MSYTSRRPEGYTEKQLKGIDLSVRGLMRKYPFILGWELDDEHDVYKTMIKIELFVSVDKIIEMYGIEVNDYILDTIKSGNRFGLYSPLLISKDYTKVKDENNTLTKQIQETLNKIYSNLPSDFKFFIYYKFDFNDEETPSIANLVIDEFIFK